MRKAVQLPNGNLRVPFSTETEEGDIIDGIREIGPDDPSYQSWLAFLPRLEGAKSLTPKQKTEQKIAQDTKLDYEATI